MTIRVSNERSVANMTAEILRGRRETTFALRHLAQSVDLFSIRASHAEMSKREQRVFNLGHFKEDDHERPGSVAQPDCPLMAEHDLHPSILSIKFDARLKIRGGQCDVSQANIGHCQFSLGLANPGLSVVHG